MMSLTSGMKRFIRLIYMIFGLSVRINCRTINISDYNHRFGDINSILKTLRELQPENNMQLSEEEHGNDTQRWPLISTECKRQIDVYLDGIINMEMWALEMLEASSIFLSGVFSGNMKDIGMYDECLSIHAAQNNLTVIGRHCMYTVSIIIPQWSVEMEPMLSICVPAMCNADEIRYLLRTVTNIISRNLTDLDLMVTSVTCSDVDTEPWDIGTIITSIVLGSFVCFLMACTMCECLANMNVLTKTDASFLSELCKFSLYSNGKRVLTTGPPSNNLSIIAGLKFFSMCWIILGHTYSWQVSGVVINLADLIPWVRSWKALVILLAPFAVDTFFVISGCLISYHFFEDLTNLCVSKFIMLYVYRYMRLTPALGVLLLLTIFILPRMGSGPLWRLTMDTQKNICSEHWWNLLLYIQNYRNTEVLACLDHTWYLAVDMQLFWISPFILYPLAKKPKVGIFILMILGIASIIAPAIVTIQNEYSGGLFNPNRLTSLVDTLSNYYVRTYVRAAPWIMGLYTGYKIRSTGNLPGINFVRFGWILTSVAALFIFLTYRIFQTDDYKFNVYWEGFYAGFSRCIWGFGICWIIYSSALGYGGFINNFLSCSIFLPFNRISYSVYLVHNLIQMMKINAARTSEYFSDLHMINIFFSDVVESVLVGFFFCVLFESPFLILNKMILLKMRRSNRMKNDCDHSQQTMAQIVLTTIRA